MDTESILQIIQAVSLTAAAWAAIYGINAWRTEFVGKKRIDLAEEVLARFYEARDAISMIRSPAGYVGEGSSRQAGEHESPEEKPILDNAYVVFERYGKHRELFSHLQSLRYRFMAQFGVDAVQPFDDLSRILNEIFISARMLAHYWREQGRRTWPNDEAFQKHLAEMRRHEAVFWAMSEDDKIAPRVDEAVRKIEEICSSVTRQEQERRFLSLIALKFPIRTGRKNGQATRRSSADKTRDP